ncbi:hypothetical protein D9M68_684100 [compost metagenome]
MNSAGFGNNAMCVGPRTTAFAAQSGGGGTSHCPPVTRCSSSAVHTGEACGAAPGRSAASTGAGRSGSGVGNFGTRRPHHTGSRRAPGRSGMLPRTRTSICSTSFSSRPRRGARRP